MIAITLTLSSIVPRPQTNPSATSPENGPWIHDDSVPGSTGTTSICAINNTGLAASSCSLPGKQQAMAANDLWRQRGVHLGEACLQVAMKGPERGGIGIRSLCTRNGLEADRPGESFDGGVIDRDLGDRLDRDLDRPGRHGPDHNDHSKASQDQRRWRIKPA